MSPKGEFWVIEKVDDEIAPVKIAAKRTVIIDIEVTTSGVLMGSKSHMRAGIKEHLKLVSCCMDGLAIHWFGLHFDDMGVATDRDPHAIRKIDTNRAKVLRFQLGFLTKRTEFQKSIGDRVTFGFESESVDTSSQVCVGEGQLEAKNRFGLCEAELRQYGIEEGEHPVAHKVYSIIRQACRGS